MHRPDGPTASGNQVKASAGLRAERSTSGANRRSFFERAHLQNMFFYPLVAVLVTAILWYGTFSLIRMERDNARVAAVKLTQELMETYESRVVRILREINLQLRLLQYGHDHYRGPGLLDSLAAGALLPPPLIFDVIIVGPGGQALATTGGTPSARALAMIAKSARTRDELAMHMADGSGAEGNARLYFSRPLHDTAGTFAGAAVIGVDAGFFVSDYDIDKLGQEGLLGIISREGNFRVTRSGNDVTVAAVESGLPGVPDTESGDAIVETRVLPWDRVERFVSARQLYEFPLKVIVGLGRGEQLAVAERNASAYLYRAIAANFLLMVVIGLLWRLSYKLNRSHRQAVEARMAQAEQAEYLAFHDQLTGLANRGLFHSLLHQAIQQARRHNRNLAVLFLDLDHFKFINDTLGHEAGDLLLVEAASRLRANLRASDTVARLGGDEFAVLLPEVSDEDYALGVAKKLITAIAAPYTIMAQSCHITVSIGISLYPDHGVDEQVLVKNADAAMYQAKREGKNGARVYSPEMGQASLERMSLEASLQQALLHEEFRLHYQAKYTSAGDQIAGTEALLRWNHPELGLLSPGQFLDIAEESGLMIPLGRWVLRTACEQTVKWQRAGMGHLTVAVNLTARQFFHPALVDDVRAILAETGLQPSLLELELTEGLLLRDVNEAMKVLTRLRAIGVRLVIDDFGVGYTALSVLKRFSLDAIKIDRSFVHDILSNNEDQALARAIIAMGHDLSLTVVAQGVETGAQADFLRDCLCDQFQGFFFNRPLPSVVLEGLLTEHTPA